MKIENSQSPPTSPLCDLRYAQLGLKKEGEVFPYVYRDKVSKAYYDVRFNDKSPVR